MDGGDVGDKRDVRRPMNAFLIFCKRHRSIVREKNPDLDNRSVTRILGDLWANLKDEEKSMYTDLAKQYKDAFMKANPDYKWHNPEKTVVPQKPAVPKPTNMKVIKNDLDVFSEGSIMPGKLADPSNMGGLSLLLIAGQQSDNGLNSNRPTETLTAISMPHTSDHGNTQAAHTVGPLDGAVIIELGAGKTGTNGGVHEQSLGDCRDDPNKETVGRECMKQQDVAPYGNGSSLFDLAEMCSTHQDGKKDSQKDVKDTHSLLVGKVDYTKQEKDAKAERPASNMAADSNNSADQAIVSNTNAKGELDSKENVSKVSLSPNTSEISEPENEESALITCGKLVVNHIIDKLYSSEIATAARNVTKPVNGGPSETVNTSIKTESVNSEHFEDIETTKQEAEGKVVIKSDSKLIKLDEPNGLHDQKVSTDREDAYKHMDGVSKGSDIKQCSTELCEDTESYSQDNTASSLYTDVSTGARKHLLSETGSTEGEDLEESQPVRKSRRRNRGQRYQELINEGIIQPSKERMAALQQPNQKDEMVEEDFQSIDSYILPETAIRRIRKRTTSESAKDKMFQSDDAKRYKTGDFDLEAHIATLPACPIENMGRKRGLFRSRHCSESSHIRKSPADDLHIVPVFASEKIVSLPPHVRLPSPQRTTEPVVGSRKRKARKHSITHLIPVPPVLRTDSKSSQNANHTIETTEPVLQTHRSDVNKPHDSITSTKDNGETTLGIGDGTDSKVDSSGINGSENQFGTGPIQATNKMCDGVNIEPKTGCDMESAETVGDNDACSGAAVDVDELIEDKDFNENKHTHVSSKTEGQGQMEFSSGVFGAENKQQKSVEICLEDQTGAEKFQSALGISDIVSSGRLVERSYKSLQEVDSNIPRAGSEVIAQDEAGDNVARKPILQDSLDKKGPNGEKPETDLNFNSTVHA